MLSIFAIAALGVLGSGEAVSPITNMDSASPFAGDRLMEFGTVYVTAGSWSTVATEYEHFSNGKVFVSIIQSTTVDTFSFPLSPRITRVQAHGRAHFDVSLFYPSGDQCTQYTTPQRNDNFSAMLSWMVVEDGGYTLDSGKVQLVIGTQLVSSVPTLVYWSHRFGTYCSPTGGTEDVSQPAGFFTIQSMNDAADDKFMVVRVSGWDRVNGQCDFSWRQSLMWIQVRT